MNWSNRWNPVRAGDVFGYVSDGHPQPCSPGRRIVGPDGQLTGWLSPDPEHKNMTIAPLHGYAD